MEDPFLNYFALGLLFFVVIVLVYGVIAIHDIPARIAHARHHPHEDAIHAAGWISLFTLHARLARRAKRPSTRIICGCEAGKTRCSSSPSRKI